MTTATIHRNQTDSAVSVRSIDSAAEFRAFFEFPWVVHRNDPNWAPPLLSMRKELLDPKKNPAWDYIEGQYFGAWRGDELVGTITAFINHRHNDYWDENIGWFGTFDLYDDQEVATALLETASEWVRERGYDAIRGPQSFTTHEETGLLVENFQPATIMMPYNPPYYAARILEADLGFSPQMDIVSFYYDHDLAAQHNFRERLRKIAERAKRTSNITVRPVNGRRKADEFAIMREIYNAAWDKNWGFVPMTDGELDALVESLGFLADPDLMFIAEIDGDPAGMMISVPDFNEALIKVRPRPGIPEPISLLQLGWHWKIARTIKGLRCPWLGVKAAYRDRGIEIALMHHMYEAIIPTQYNYMDAGWVLETNELVTISIKLGADPYKRHRYYERSLT